MIKWTITEVELPLKVDWNISRNSSVIKKNFVIELKNGQFRGLGEVAFNVRYGESREIILSKFEEFKTESSNTEFNGVESVVAFMDRFDFPQSLKFGIESAFVDYLSHLSGKTIPQFLGVNTVSAVKTSFSIPIMEKENIEKFIVENNLNRFSSLKIKVNNKNALELTEEVLKNAAALVRIDANEAFLDHEEVMSFLNQISDLKRIEFLEQPLPAGAHDEALLLKKVCPVKLIADESVTKEEITSYFVERFDGINIKLMKSGGYLKGLKQMRQAKILGLKVMIGCMIETSLGISSAMNIASGFDYYDLDGFLLLKEDPYKMLSEENGKIFYSFIQ
jgi:L-alanine-DL-glutamate epimerase-like enolase superfamily enzyme